MKKLVIALAAVAMAAGVQAASINWTITNVYQPGSETDKVAVGSASAYLFVTENTTDVDSFTVTTQAAIESFLASGDISGATALSSAHKTNAAAGAFTGSTDLTGFSSGSLSAFAVVFDSADATTANNYFLVAGGDTKTVSFTSATGAKALGWGDQTSYTQGASGSWQAVPEPTSGLLMLMGLAGLALRRRRA